MTENETAWVAGLIEGEGTFTWKRPGSPVVKVQMTDLDVLERLLRFTGMGTICACSTQQPHHKPSWSWQVQARADAIALMRTIYPWMGTRRAARIRLMLDSLMMRAG